MIAFETSSSCEAGRPGFLLMQRMLHHGGPPVKDIGPVFAARDFVASVFLIDWIACPRPPSVARSEPSRPNARRESHGAGVTRPPRWALAPWPAQGWRGRRLR